jgi:hypothetical protein
MVPALNLYQQMTINLQNSNTQYKELILILNIEINLSKEINLIPSARHEDITEIEKINSTSLPMSMWKF